MLPQVNRFSLKFKWSRTKKLRLSPHFSVQYRLCTSNEPHFAFLSCNSPRFHGKTLCFCTNTTNCLQTIGIKFAALCGILNLAEPFLPGGGTVSLQDNLHLHCVGVREPRQGDVVHSRDSYREDSCKINQTQSQ